MFSNDDFSPLFDNNDLDALALAQCNTLGRWPILPLSATLEPAIVDGSLSDDPSSPITPLDAFNLGVHTLFAQQHDPFGTGFNQCLPMSALYAPPVPLPSDIDTASTSDGSSPDSDSSRPQTAIAPIVPSQADSASKKRAAPADGTPPAKKPRVVNTRVRAKDFVPPDVSGLTKREARLVKNRAAAFLSRQRKREEFEAMEIRLTDLERENSELRRASHGDALDISEEAEDSLSGPDRQLASLRRLLRSAEDREAALKRELQKLRQSSPGSEDGSPSPMDSSQDAVDDLQPSTGLMAMLSLSSVLPGATSGNWMRDLAAADASLAFCDAESGIPEIEVTTTTLADGKVRVSMRRPSIDLARPLSTSEGGNQNQKRVRLSLARAQLGDHGAELDVEVR